MRRSFAFLTFLALSSLPCAAAVSGTVTDRVGNGLSGVGVSLALAGTSTTTGAKGTWSLAPTGIDARPVATSRTRWTGKAAELTLAEPSTVSVEAYDLKGAQQGRLSSVKLGAGSHSLPLALFTSGMVWLRVTVNGRSETVFGGIGMGGASIVGAIHESPLPNPTAARSQGIGDTLLFTWKAKVVARIALSNLDTSGIVVKIGTDSSIAWNDSITYGSVYDARDGQVYRAVKIGTQTWMAENLNYSGASGSTGVCYNNDTANCTKYGHLYIWSEVMAGHVSSITSPSGVQGICPSGWHVPSDDEWSTMQSVVDPTNTADGTKLKSTSGWDNGGNGTDTYGFRFLPAGGRYSDGVFAGLGGSASFWSASEYGATGAWNRDFYDRYAGVDRYSSYKTDGFSLRCLEDYSILAMVAKPTFSPAAGMYTSTQSVTLSSTTSGASIYYTVDERAPTTSSTLYSGAISVSTSETLKAIAVKSGMTNSAISSAAYTIIPWQTSITYGSVTYGGQSYKTVKIGTQTWMAENLNYAGSGTTIGVCYNSSADSCTKYGRLYTWAEVMAGHASSTASPSGVQGICPSGWHVPSDSEWSTMQSVVDASHTTDGTKLKSTAGWNIYNGISGNGTDTYGFRALPGGRAYSGSSYYAGNYGYWWSATEIYATYAWSRYMSYFNADVYRDNDRKTNEFSLRCLED